VYVMVVGETITATGDINGDGRVTSADATFLARYIVGQDVYLLCRYAADLNGDGNVCIADLILLSRWLAGHNVTVVRREVN